MSAKAATETVKVHLGQHGKEIQKFGTVIRRPIGLSQEVCEESVKMLVQVEVDLISMRDLYKKSHWQVTGPTFYQLHLLFDKHFGEQVDLIDAVAERIQTLGGISIAMGADAAELTKVPRPPRGREEAPVMISRLLEAHEIVLKEAREFARKAADAGDDGTNDLLVSQVVRTNEAQVWFIAEHLVDVPLI